MKDKFSMKNFALGFLAGAAVILAADYVLVSQGVQAVENGSWENVPIVQDVLDVARRSVQQENSTSVHGSIVRVGDTDFEVKANRQGAEVTLRFTYNSTSEFVRINNDDNSTESAINPHDLVVGDSVTIQAAEPIGSVENQRAVKVFKI